MKTALPFLAALILPAAFAGGDDPQAAARKELQPRPVTFPAPALPLSEALAQLRKDTGNVVLDLRKTKSDPKVSLPTGPTNFWAALDAIGKSSGIGFSTYLPDGGVALTDAPYRPMPTAHAGLYRVTMRTIRATRDEETGDHACNLALDIAWEPRFEPLLLSLRKVRATYAMPKPQTEQAADADALSVHAISAVELDVRFKAPPRACPKIASLKGELVAVGPAKMLAFSFSKLAAIKKGGTALTATQDEVTVSVTRLELHREEVEVEVQIRNPKGNPAFDSYQSWLGNNRLTLETGQGAKRRVLVPSPEKQIDEKATFARVAYFLKAEAGQSLPPASFAGWTLTYTTPGRIIETVTPFELKDLLLP